MDAAERRRQALELRKAGVDFRTIADRLGYEGPSGAHKAVTTALKALTAEPAEELRALMLEQHRAMLKAIWPSVVRADLKAIDRAIRILAAIADLEGINAPKEIKVNHDMQALADRVAESLGLNTADIMAEAERIIAEAGVAS